MQQHDSDTCTVAGIDDNDEDYPPGSSLPTSGDIESEQITTIENQARSADAHADVDRLGAGGAAQDAVDLLKAIDALRNAAIAAVAVGTGDAPDGTSNPTMQPSFGNSGGRDDSGSGGGGGGGGGGGSGDSGDSGNSGTLLDGRRQLSTTQQISARRATVVAAEAAEAAVWRRVTAAAVLQVTRTFKAFGPDPKPYMLNHIPKTLNPIP